MSAHGRKRDGQRNDRRSVEHRDAISDYTVIILQERSSPRPRATGYGAIALAVYRTAVMRLHVYLRTDTKYKIQS